VTSRRAVAWRIFCPLAKRVTGKRDRPTSRAGGLFAGDAKNGTSGPEAKNAEAVEESGEVGRRNGCALFWGAAKKVPEPGI
jgi:hypothetical protein